MTWKSLNADSKQCAPDPPPPPPPHTHTYSESFPNRLAIWRKSYRGGSPREGVGDFTLYFFITFFFLFSVYVEHLHRPNNIVVLAHSMEVPSMPTRDCKCTHMYIHVHSHTWLHCVFYLSWCQHLLLFLFIMLFPAWESQTQQGKAKQLEIQDKFVKKFKDLNVSTYLYRLSYNECLIMEYCMDYLSNI